MQKMTFVVISKQIVDCEVIEVETQVTTRGVRQPLPPQKLEIYKDGQRAWKYECLHLLPKPAFNPDDIVVWNGKKYRVVEKYDCSEYGYIEYNGEEYKKLLLNKDYYSRFQNGERPKR